MGIDQHRHELQSMRGIAAAVVLIGHCVTTLAAGRWEDPNFHFSLGNSLLAIGELVFQQNTAVVFFFVLSGLVLGQSLARGPGLAGFALRRVFRLFPLMWVSILFALLLRACQPAGPFDGATSWFNTVMAQPISAGHVISDLAGLSWYTNSVLWSVQIEVIMIVLLPILWAIERRLSARGDLVAVAALALLGLLLWNRLPNAANTIRYSYCFFAGLALPKLALAYEPYFRRREFALIALLLLIPTEWLYDTGRLWMPYKLVVDMLASAQLLGFVILRPQTSTASWLRRRALVWLGDISYSFYVFAFSLQMVIAGFLLPKLQPSTAAQATGFTLVLIILTGATALALAALTYRLVEQPMIALGHRLSRRLAAPGCGQPPAATDPALPETVGAA